MVGRAWWGRHTNKRAPTHLTLEIIYDISQHVIFSLEEAFVAPFDAACITIVKILVADLLVFLNETKGQLRVFEPYLNGKRGPQHTQANARVLTEHKQRNIKTQLTHKAHWVSVVTKDPHITHDTNKRASRRNY